MVSQHDKTKHLTYSKASISSTGLVCLKLWKPIQVQHKLLTGALHVPFLQHHSSAESHTATLKGKPEAFK